MSPTSTVPTLGQLARRWLAASHKESFHKGLILSSFVLLTCDERTQNMEGVLYEQSAAIPSTPSTERSS